MKYIIYLFYKYYNKDATARIPYESSIFALLLLLFMNIFGVLIFFFPTLSVMIFSNHSRVELYVYSLIVIFVCYLILSKLFPKNEILLMNGVSKNEKLHGWILFFYIFISFVILMILIIKNRK